MEWPKKPMSRQSGTTETWLVDECAAFVTGTYRELLEAHAMPVPAWAWVNALAHGSDEVVTRLAAGPAGRDSPESYVARLARHTLVKMRYEGVSLRDVQSTILVPLELAIAARAGNCTVDRVTLSRAVARELLAGLEPLGPGPQPEGR